MGPELRYRFPPSISFLKLEANGATAKPQPRLGLKRPKPSSSMLSEHWIFPSQKRTWPLPRQKKMWRVLMQSAASLRKEAELAGVRLKAGEISNSDRSQIEITAERFELDARTAESTAAQTRVALEVLLGVPKPKGDILLTEQLETLCAAVLSLDARASEANRPDVIAADAAMRKAEAELRLQKANRIPNPTVLGVSGG